MKASLLFLILCLCLSLLSGCASVAPAPALATSAANPATANPPTETLAAPASTPTPLPPTLTSIPTLASTLAPTLPAATLSPTAVPTHQPDWTFAAGGPIWGPVTESSGVVYFGCEDAYLYAVDVKTHALKWKFKAGGAVRSRPEVSKTLVYAVSDDSVLFAVSIDSGALAWKTPIGTYIDQREPQFDLANQSTDILTSGPALQDGVVYVGGTDDHLYAINAENGQVIWKFAAASMATRIRFTPAVGNGMVYFEDDTGDFYAVSAKTGTQAWVYETGVSYGNGATLVDQMVYTGGGNNITAIDALTGKVKWATSTYVDWEIPAVADGVLYGGAGSSNDEFTIGAYDAATGKALWVVDAPVNYLIASPVIGKNNVYFGETLSGFYAVDKKSGVIQWEIPFTSGSDGVGVNSTAAVTDGMVYFGGMDGKLYAVKDE